MNQPHFGLKLLVSIACVLIVLFHTFVHPLPNDSTTICLLLIAVFPWLQPIFKSIKLPGGIELTLQEIEKKVEAATGAALSAERKADLAVSGLTGGSAVPRGASVSAASLEQLSRLGESYEVIRATQTSGPARTQAMTAVVRQMIEASQSLIDFDPGPYVRSTKQGERLAGYAYLYAKPDPSKLQDLVTSVTALEPKPFGQYWGLQAIGRNFDHAPTAPMPDSVMRDLLVYASRVQPGTDRDYEVRRILGQVRARSGTPA